jgi:hypothetical protein
MSFDENNIPQIYQCNLNKTFQEYIYMFMKNFLDDYIIFNTIDISIEKLKLHFLECLRFDINLKLEKYDFMVLSILMFEFIVSQ